MRSVPPRGSGWVPREVASNAGSATSGYLREVSLEHGPTRYRGCGKTRLRKVDEKILGHI